MELNTNEISIENHETEKFYANDETEFRDNSSENNVANIKNIDLISYVNSHIDEQNKEINNQIDGEKHILQTLNNNDKNIDGTITDSGLKKLNLKSWKQYPWKCVVCNAEFYASLELISHFKLAHPKESLSYDCMDCTKTFTKYITFLNHVKKRHRTHLKYCCDICFKFFWNLKQLKIHRLAVHSNILIDDVKAIADNFKCLMCNKIFSSQNNLLVHQKLHLDVKEKYKCDVCEKEFMAKPNLIIHKRIHSGMF